MPPGWCAAPRIPLQTLNPLLLFNGDDFVLMTQNMASIRVAQLGHAAGTLVSQRDQIIRAIDALLSGILRGERPTSVAVRQAGVHTLIVAVHIRKAPP